ncbi:hypothetical protein J7T55_014482 [Diaporthe amygdali]|uniref:uncharacterized protein n=1 Tax=Phomopsis amygdali TaxID=1214568 RepID=UPI0022FED67D|nr:uncharacterized protein J7T55_014482 [Diaporthe amygdali]KAJ0118029.1 hypothetical protein J7T55_014482 [Diaporthe amygdali]
MSDQNTPLQNIGSVGNTAYQTFVELPYRAFTTPRQAELPAQDEKDMKNSPDKIERYVQDSRFTNPVSDELLNLLTSPESVSTLLAQDPSLSPGEAWKKLYGHHVGNLNNSLSAHGAGNDLASEEALHRAAEAGHWGPTQPSELFLRIYHDAIGTLHDDPGHAMVSPSLMGSCGVVPLSIISTVPDIVRHMSNCIVRAEREVFLATNFWQNSDASKFITDAMKELSRRAGERGTKIVMKMIYDRGSPKQLFEPHYVVPVKEYTGDKVGIPPPEEIPNIDLQVMNYHHPLLGTFHAKYMVVDRKLAVIQSNNIQNNDNLEMMIHLEGPIVDSMYDMALLSWHKRLEPPLPSHNSPAANGGISCFTESHSGIFEPSGSIRGHHVVIDPGKMQSREAYEYTQTVPQPGLVDGQNLEAESNDPDRADAVTGPSTTSNTVPGTHASAPESRLNDDGQVGAQNGHNGPDVKTEALLNEGQQANNRLPMPSSTADSLPEHTHDDPHWDSDISSEVMRVQAAVSAKNGETTMQAVNRHLNHTVNVGFSHDAPECAPADEMTPYIPHPTHEPFPIAMVNRAPYGPPNHKSVVMPQNAAWLSALRNAKKNVFIQSPTLNAEPLVPAIVEACERGIDVYCYICLGYNDAGELLPMQGGHNDMVAHHLYTALSPAAKQRLHYFWYVGKDQTRPIIQEKKKRSCHIKLMIADEHIGIQGNGNQDTQSWYHSQEINVMLDSAQVCRAWIDGLRRNQNTHLYGALDKETGIWTDADGKQADGAIGIDPGRFSWTRGVVGAVKRLQGTGGF